MEDISAALVEEDISFLTTNQMPSANDADVIKSRNTKRKEIIREINQRIAALQVLCDRLTVACEIGDAIVAPIRCIPTEILGEILVQCIPALPTVSSTSHPYPQDVAKLLGNVCHRWRAIVNDTPRIWSTLVLDRAIQAPEDVYKLLVKSKSCPLDIFIRSCNWFPHRHEEAKKCIDVFEMLRSQFWRIQSLMSDIPPYTRFQTGGAIFPNGPSIHLPIMQTLSYTGRTGTPSIDGDFPRFHCPELRSVSVKDCEPMLRSLVANPVPTVRHLAVCFSGCQTLFLHLLRTLPNLVSLRCSGCGELPEMPRAVVLKSLKSLRVHASGSVMAVLRCLQVPSLESLELLVGGQFVYDAICALCEDGSVKLRRLHIANGELPGPAIRTRSWLRQLDHLETLIIERSNKVDGLLIELAPLDQDFSLVCPRLTTLVIGEADFSSALLMEFVYRRTQADWKETAPGFIKCLKVTETPKLLDALSRQLVLLTHSATIHLMLTVDYHCTPMGFSTTLPERRYGWDV